MSPDLPQKASLRLEGSCGVSPRDWIRLAPDQDRVQRIEAFFTGHAFDPHRHDTYALGLTLSGVQRFDYRGAEANSLTGNLIVIHPDEVHNGRAGASSGFCYRMVYIEPRLIRDALGRQATALPFARTAVLDDGRLRAALILLLADLSREFEPIETDQAIAAVADALLALDPSAQRRYRSGDCGSAVERARAFLDANHERVVGSEELEATTGLDRYECARQFRRRLGTSPYRYLTMRRLDRARALIRSGAALADAAVDTGFADQSHMTRQFKRTYGLSPGRWREMQTVGQAA